MENHSKSSAPVMVGVLVIVLVVGAGIFAAKQMKKETMTPLSQTKTAQVSPTSTTQQTPATSMTNKDTSDQQLDKDLNTIDSQMSNLDSQNSSVNTALQDQSDNQ